MEGLLPLLGALVQYGAVAVTLGLLILGVLRVGKYVDEERVRILAERDAREAAIIADRDRREAAIIAERDRREAILVSERDDWRDRALAYDSRLDRVAAAFERLAKMPAPE